MTISDSLEGRLNFERHLHTATTRPESLVSVGASLGKMVVSTDLKHLEAIVGDHTALKEGPGPMVSISTLESQKRTLALSVWIFFRHFISWLNGGKA